MSLSRALLAFVVVLLSLLSLTSAQDPTTHCSPVTVDAFSVAAGTAGTEGTFLSGSMVNGTYPTQQYNVTLPTAYTSTSIFFRIFLTPNSTIHDVGTIGVTFTAALNGVLKNISATNGNPQVYSPDPTTGAADVEFFNWITSPRVNSNNYLMLNVSEVITVGQDVTQCFYVYNILYINPFGTPGTGANNVTSTGGFITGDPQFVGLRGQSFQVHGVDGAVYNLISDKAMQLNSRFTFLEGPRPCPVMPSTGRVSVACWSHPGSYLSELALKTIGGSQLHIVSGDAATGFASITLNGKALKVGDEATLDFAKSGLTGSVSIGNAFELSIHAGHFDLVIENNDGFVNLRSVSVAAASWSKLASHGLLGQTWANKRYSGKIKYIEGDVDDYLIEDDNLFGDEFLYNRFSQ